MKRALSLLLSLLLAMMLVGCGADSAASADFNSSESYTGDFWAAEDAEYDYSEQPETRGEATDSGTAKMIYTGYIELETQNFDTASSSLETLVTELGGYFQQSSVSNRSSGYRYGSYTVRVPAAEFENFFQQVGELCHMTYKNANADNVSESYYDTEARLETARIKLERLQTLLAKAATMEDIITIESAISETERDIEELSGTLRHYDALVDYATIDVELNEVYKLSGQDEAATSFGGRMRSAFSNGLKSVGSTLEDLAVWLAYSWVWLIVLAAAVVVVVRLVRRGHSGKSFSLRHKKRGGKDENSTGE